MEFCLFCQEQGKADYTIFLRKMINRFCPVTKHNACVIYHFSKVFIIKFKKWGVTLDLERLVQCKKNMWWWIAIRSYFDNTIWYNFIIMIAEDRRLSVLIGFYSLSKFLSVVRVLFAHCVPCFSEVGCL